jgi:hypothetical protein
MAKGDPFKTKKYDMFVNDEANRDVTNIRPLMKSMKLYGFHKAYPLHVTKGKDGKLHIKDGGHRFEAAKALGLEVYYVVCDNDEISIPEINNTQRRWKLKDYVSSQVRMGNEEYLKLQEFSRSHDISMQASARLLFGEQAMSGNADKYVKSGAFRVRDEDYASRVASILVALAPVTKLVKHSVFINAVSRCCLLKEFDAARFVRNAQRMAAQLVPQATLDAFLDLCESIYNDHMGVKSRYPLKFEANLASAQRNKNKNKAAA